MCVGLTKGARNGARDVFLFCRFGLSLMSLYTFFLLLIVLARTAAYCKAE